MSIFDEKNKVTSSFFSFKEVGNKIEGTLVGIDSVNNQLSGKEQQIYELKCVDGEYRKVGGKPGIDSQMKRVRLGQIVGFEFISEKESKTPGFSPTKIIQVYADPEIVDKEWVENQDVDVSKLFGSEEAEENGEDAVKPDGSILNDIEALAIGKLGAKDAEDVRTKVMEKTSLAFIEANYADIKSALEALPEK